MGDKLYLKLDSQTVEENDRYMKLSFKGDKSAAAPKIVDQASKAAPEGASRNVTAAAEHSKVESRSRDVKKSELIETARSRHGQSANDLKRSEGRRGKSRRSSASKESHTHNRTRRYHGVNSCGWLFIACGIVMVIAGLTIIAISYFVLGHEGYFRDADEKANRTSSSSS